MRSFVWLALGLMGFALSYSTRSDQTFSTIRLIGCILLAIGSFGLLPRYPVEQPTPRPAAAAAQPQPVAARRPQPIPSQAAPEPAPAQGARQRSLT